MALSLMVVALLVFFTSGRRANEPGVQLDFDIGIVPMFIPMNLSGASSRQSPFSPSLELEESTGSTAQSSDANIVDLSLSSPIGIVSALSSLWKAMSEIALTVYAAQVPLVTSIRSGARGSSSTIVHRDVAASLSGFTLSADDIVGEREAALAEPATAEASEVPEALLIESAAKSESIMPEDGRSASGHRARSCYAAFMFLNTWASVMFFIRGAKYVREVGESSVPRVSQSAVFHYCISSAAAVLAVCNAMSLLEQPLILVLPWLYCARGVATSLLFFAFSARAGVEFIESLAVAIMGLMAWIQLGAAALIRDLDLYWGLSISGLVCGALAVRTLSGRPEQLAGQPQTLRSMRRVSDFIVFCGLLYVALWLMEVFAIVNLAFDALLSGFLDMWFIVGCGHLLLKTINPDSTYMTSTSANP